MYRLTEKGMAVVRMEGYQGDAEGALRRAKGAITRALLAVEDAEKRLRENEEIPFAYMELTEFGKEAVYDGLEALMYANLWLTKSLGE